MVTNHYDLLGIEQTAGPQEIKRAYFTLVRQYPPERFPEEFKRLRTAYETLSDEQRRAAYDKNGLLPEDIALLVQEARNACLHGKYSQALKLYRAILNRHPALAMIMKEYAMTLEKTGKKKEAMKTREALCELAPDNAEYTYDLAWAYEKRGWDRKALARYKRTLEIDGGSAASWSAIIDYHIKARKWEEARKVCAEAIEVVKEKDSGTLYLYSQAFSLEPTTASAEDHLKNIVRLMRSGRQEILNEGEMAVSHLLNFCLTAMPDEMRFFPYIEQMMELLPHARKGLDEPFREAKSRYDIENLDKDGFSDIFHDLLWIQLGGYDIDEDAKDDDHESAKNNKIAMECIILDERKTYFPQLLRLKKEYPHLYELHRTFFDEALSASNPEKMLRQRTKILSKHNLSFAGSQDVGGYGDEEDFPEPVQTVRREQPKVGRNDPCPCGSGKKYKKCCGA
jgi:curved DNA-binding protein CbpA